MLRNAYDLLIIVAVLLLASLGSFPIASSLSSITGGGTGGGDTSSTSSSTGTPTSSSSSSTGSGGGYHLLFGRTEADITAGGTLQPVQITLNPQGASVGAVDLDLEYDKSKISLINITSFGFSTYQVDDAGSSGTFIKLFNDTGSDAVPVEEARVIVMFTIQAAAGASGSTAIEFGPETVVSDVGLEIDSLSTRGLHITISP